MKNIISLLCIYIVIISACSNPNKENRNNKRDNAHQENTDKQLNISILLDLSDRLERDLQPNQPKRDIAIINNIAKIFRQEMENKGAFNSKGKIRILFKPTPKNPDINKLAKNLSIDLSEMQNDEKKKVYDNFQTAFQTNLEKIYDITLKSKNWIGSDLWRFFKNDIDDFCIEPDSNYTNILILLTDGYIYHEQSTNRYKNRTAYLTPNYLEKEGFRNNPHWREKFENGDYGLISFDKNLENLEVLVLEINSSKIYKNDEDIITTFLEKWFKEFNVKRFEVYNTDLPQNTKIRIENYFGY